jgi:hypothetical protein
VKRTLGIVILLLLTPSFLFCQDKEEVISLLNELDLRSTRFENEITFIDEFNFGIPGGSNWLVQWYQLEIGRSSITTMVYVVDTDTKEIKFRDFVSLKSGDIPPYLFSYYQNLPGITIADGICQIGDFNDDGFDEILGLDASYMLIRGYDPQTNKIKSYCNLRYGDVDEGYSSPPVEFITYKGMYGFKLRYFAYDVAGGPGYVFTPEPKNGRWFFYEWDKGKREFVEIEEFVEEINSDYLVETSVGTVVSEDFDITEIESMKTFAIGKSEKRTQSKLSSDSGKNSRFYFYIAIAVGVIALALAVFFVVRRKKG